MTWALPEWTVLAVLRQEPAHGFAVAALTGADGALGRIWRIPRPLVYRALARLQQAELIAPVAVESGAGPQRTIYAITDAGRVAVDVWLQQPVEHVRDMRSQLLMKLALLDRLGADPTELLRLQRRALEPIVRALAADRFSRDGFDGALLEWRYSSADAALRFVRTLEERRQSRRTG